MKKMFLWLILFWGWVILITKLLNFAPPEEYPTLRTRLGTVLHHSSDINGVYLGAYKNSAAVDHIYCYYPKGKVGKVIKQAQKITDCAEFFGTLVIREPGWVSEYQKFWWSKEQFKESSS